MFKSLKQLPSPRHWGKIATRRMNRTLKNLKITPATHQRLKVYAAEKGVNISDCADVLLAACLDEGRITRSTLDAKIIELKTRDFKTE